MTPEERLPIHRVEKVDSTNRLARREIESGALDASTGRFYIAREQSGGVGRHGRKWHSPEGGLWCTAAWPVPTGHDAPDPRMVALGLGLRVGVAALTAISESLTRHMARVMPMLKWPNDVLLKRRKACGTLCEALVTGPEFGRTAWLIVGVGVNVNNDVSELPQDLRRAPIAMRDVCAEDIDLEALALRMRAALFDALNTTGVDDRSLKIARERLYGKGSPITIVAPGGVHMPGTLVTLNEDGVPVLRMGKAEFAVPPGSELE
ncbi:MAG: biotin--[acetyl-CoA-carboxylase] ligase [Planctomycetes bacterium]|nr:biotin--[acetyl-CoA-carboxylase] ligase [Planctomycetota bacterium]